MREPPYQSLVELPDPLPFAGPQFPVNHRVEVDVAPRDEARESHRPEEVHPDEVLLKNLLQPFAKRLQERANHRGQARTNGVPPCLWRSPWFHDEGEPRRTIQSPRRP